MKREFEFTEATPLIQWIESHKEKWIGQKIAHYYRDRRTGPGKAPAVFVVGEWAVIVELLWPSCLAVTIVDQESFLADTSLNFLYKDIPESRNVRFAEFCFDDKTEFVGKRITNILVNRFSGEHETHPDLGGVRPKGGDYFAAITVELSNGNSFSICAEDALFDGYMTVWE